MQFCYKCRNLITERPITHRIGVHKLPRVSWLIVDSITTVFLRKTSHSSPMNFAVIDKTWWTDRHTGVRCYMLAYQYSYELKHGVRCALEGKTQSEVCLEGKAQSEVCLEDKTWSDVCLEDKTWSDVCLEDKTWSGRQCQRWGVYCWE